MTTRSPTVQAADDDAALEWLHANQRTDGLPVVIPTAARVQRLVDATGLAADHEIGAVAPNLGAATVERVAINAVMAGCTPAHMPLLVAAVRAICDPRLDIGEIQGTTHNLGPLLIVNGPMRAHAGISGGFGALGYGHRGNLSVGRALRLCLINIGGGWPGTSDMALLGQPGKISYCLAEDEEASPFPPLHTSLGFDADQSTVTVASVEAPHSVLAFLEADDPTTPDRILHTLGAAIAGLGSNNAHSGKGTVVVVLNPDHAGALASYGHTRGSIQHELFERARVRVGDLRRTAPPSRQRAFASRDDDERVPALQSPDHALVLVAGGTGLYSSVMLPWGGGPHHNSFVTVAIDHAATGWREARRRG